MSRSSHVETADVVKKRHFASDNYAGICPEAWEALAQANDLHAVSYGDDLHTERARRHIQDFFETACDVFFTFNGTAANALAVAAMCQNYQAVVCHELSHLATDECGAPEFFTGGAKVLTVSGSEGRIDRKQLVDRITARPDVHFSQVKAISVTQATETGTVYNIDELTQISQIAKEHNLFLHMDGARLANALAYLGVSPADATWKAGVDILSLGGTKNGLPMGDAVVCFQPALSEGLDYRRKQSGQLCSKMRFLSAPWSAMLDSGAYLAHAQHANQMATRLRNQLSAIPELRLLFQTQANSVFVDMQRDLRDGLYQRGWRFYALVGDNICRLMCAWDTTADDVDAFCADVREIMNR